MPPNVFSDYFDEVETAIKSIRDCHIEKYEEEFLSPERANLRVRIRFVKGHLLELNEALVYESGKLQHLAYRYHCQDPKNRLIFRYDNAPHFPNLKTFPHHKHLPNDVIPVTKPLITEVIEEAKKLA